MLTVVMVTEGVLRVPGSDAHLDSGWGLYMAMSKNFKFHLLSHDWDEPTMNLWLAKRQLKGHMSFLHQPNPGPAGRLEVLERVRSWRVSLVLEADPECAAAALSAGWNTALVTHATYTQPKWRPDYGGNIRPWDALTDAIEQQKELRLTDPRLQENQ